MNEMENKAYTYARSKAADWGVAMDFARWYWRYGRGTVAESWREWCGDVERAVEPL